MTPAQQLYLRLADLILVVHAAFVAFVVLGLGLIWIGRFRRWAFVRNLWFRLIHLAAIGVVTAQSFGGVLCPLTEWEDQLRVLAGGGERYAGSFIEHWLHRVLFFEFDERVFTAAYVIFFLLVALSFWLVPPRRRPRPRLASSG